MNVGSILNNDSPPSDTTPPPPGSLSSQRPSLSLQRHSINDLLNGPNANTISVPKPELTRSSIADITNSDDEDPPTTTDVEPVKRETETASPKTKPTTKTGIVKPKRYSTPPIWAQEWNPRNQRANGHVQAPEPVEKAESSSLSDKRVFNRGTTSSTDLECSITNTIPPSSVVRTIAEWVYANFVEIPTSNRKFVELELKFGTIIDKVTGRRLNINVSTECIYTDKMGINFDAGVHEVGWNDMKSFLDELEKLYQDELAKNPKASQPKRKFNTLDTDITDNFYQITQRGEAPKSIRVSQDNSSNPPRFSAINKQRISDLYIHNPSSMYDLRLSLSFEHPVPEGNVEGIMKRNQPSLTRMKKRTSYGHRPTVTNFDLTRVLVPKEVRTKTGRAQKEHEQTFESELEIDVAELFEGFDKFKDGLDNIRFEELVEIFMNNARCLNNRVTRLASGR